MKIASVGSGKPVEKVPAVHAADRLRRANACAEMAEQLKVYANQAHVPDVRWMAEAASEELADRAARLRSD